jgi:molybdopterin-guanine dinucleotide biosynthesis protein A
LKLVVGILVGGMARRMGGAPKGLLRTSEGERVIDRTVALARSVSPLVVLVGRSEAYDVDVPRLPDPETGMGPLAGLASLLEHAGDGHAMALACDMPFLTGELLGRLASRASTAAALAPKRDGRWEPLFARFDAARALPVVRARLERRDLALQGLLVELEADELPLSPSEARLLSDWDRPEDLP